MAIWTDRPEPGTVKSTFDLLRTPPSAPFIGTVTSTVILGTPIHFFGGRSAPCLQADDCEACKHGRQYRWMAYFAVLPDGSHKQALFEVTALIHAKFVEFAGSADQVRGIRFKVWRPSKRASGRIAVSFGTERAAEITLPDAPDVRPLMEHIWQRKLVPGDSETLPTTRDVAPDRFSAAGTDLRSPNGKTRQEGS